MTTKRIDLSLFDDNLKGLINASAKIFPISLSDVQANLNPNLYEYAKIIDIGIHKNEIYIWNSPIFELIGADDKQVDFNTEVINKPTSYPNDFSHTHNNLSTLETITLILTTSWNSAVTHISDLVKHITGAERTLWNTVTSKADATTTTNALTNKSDIAHDHDGRYNTKAEVTSGLSGKSDTTHDHNLVYAIKSTEGIVTSQGSLITGLRTDVNINTSSISSIQTNMANGDMHSNIGVLNQLTQLLLDGWNSAVTHISDAIKHITSAERSSWNAKAPLSSPIFNGDVNIVGTKLKIQDTLTLGLASEVNGQIIDYGSNYSQLGGVNNAYPGGYFRVDLRDSSQDEFFNVQFIPANGAAIALLRLSRVGNLRLTGTIVGSNLTGTNTGDQDLSSKADKSYVDTQDATKVDSTTFNGHTGNITIHVLQTDKDNWNAKENTADLFVDKTSHKVGIGTLTPTVALDIPAHNTLDNNAEFGTFGIQSYNVNNGFVQDNGYYNGTEKYRANGYIAMFQFLAGDIRFNSSPTGLKDADATLTTNIVVKNNGLVGIGTLIPTEKLHVSGNIIATGTITGSNTIQIVQGITEPVSTAYWYKEV